MKLDQWLNPTCVFSLLAISGLEAGLGMRLGGPGLPRGPGLPILGGKVLKNGARTPLFHTTTHSLITKTRSLLYDVVQNLHCN